MNRAKAIARTAIYFGFLVVIAAGLAPTQAFVQLINPSTRGFVGNGS